ncbi:MAG: Ig-like domain-containing protein [Thermofilaceae archaeon]
MRLWWLLLVLAALPLALADPVCTAQDKCGSEVCARSADCYWQEDRDCGTTFYCYAYTVGSYAKDTWGDHQLGYWPLQMQDNPDYAWGMEAYLFTYTIGQGWYSYGKTEVWGLFENFTYGQTFAYVTYQIVGKHCNCQLNWEVSHSLGENNRRVDAPMPSQTNASPIKQEWSTSSGAQSQVTVTACGSGAGWAAYRVQAGLFRVGVYIYGDVRPPQSSPQPKDTGVRVVAVIPSSGGRFWDAIVPVNITYTVGESSGSVSGYTLFTRDFKVKSTGGVIFTVTVPRSGEAYLPLRVWSCSSSYGCSYSYVAGNLTQFTVYSSRYGYGLVQAGPLTGSYTLAYRIDYYYSGGVRADFTPVTIEAGSGDSWRTLATHDKPTDGVVLLNVQLNNEYVRFKGGASGYASLATAAIAERAQVAFREWGAVCSHISYCRFYTDCSGSSYSLGVCDNIPWGYVICPGSYCSWACDPYGVACLPLIALVDAGETGFLGFRYARTPGYRITLTVRTHDGRPANGTIVRVTSSSGTVYANTTDSNGVALFTLPAGSYSVLINETYYGPTLTAGGQSTRWRRYRFWKWSDESTANPRTVNLNSDTNLTAYVWDERALLVRWEPHFDGDAWGVLNATSGARIAYDSIVWLKRGQTVQLLPVEAGGLIFTYWRVGTECYRGQPYSSDPLLTLTMGDKGLSAIAVFRLSATNQTMLPPGAGMVNPVTYIPGATMGGEERMGKRGWWLLTVTHVPTNKTSPDEAGIDGRAWIYALIVHGNGSSRWVPVTGVWRLHLAQDWDPSKHVRDLPGGVKIIEWDQSTVSDFPKILDPQEWRDWRFVTLSAWDPLVYEELGGSYDTSGLWLANGSTLALYNVTFAYMGVNGDRVEYVYWQPIAVSTLTFRAEARYTLTSHEASLGRRRILMSIYVNATWKYVPPQYWQLLGFRVHAPQLGFLASLEEPGCTSTSCIGYWAPPSRAGSSWRLYVIGLGDTEDFYSKAYPRGLLGGDGYSSVREFRISMRWLGAGNHPSTLIWGSDRVTFKLAPASVYKLEWTDPRGPFTVTWGCFMQGPSGLTPISSYTADITFDWGVLGTNRSCANPARFNGVTSPYTVNVQVPADNWIAFYVVPAGGRYEITQDGIVPVPLFAKYPPRG